MEDIPARYIGGVKVDWELEELAHSIRHALRHSLHQKGLLRTLINWSIQVNLSCLHESVNVRQIRTTRGHNIKQLTHHLVKLITVQMLNLWQLSKLQPVLRGITLFLHDKKVLLRFFSYFALLLIVRLILLSIVCFDFFIVCRGNRHTCLRLVNFCINKLSLFLPRIRLHCRTRGKLLSHLWL